MFSSTSLIPSVILRNQDDYLVYQPNLIEQLVRKPCKPLFPVPEYSISELDPQSLYNTSFSLKVASKYRSVWRNKQWKDDSVLTATKSTEEVFHPNGVKTGEHWMANDVSFPVKLTNDPTKKNHNTILIQGLYKYTPVLTITKVTKDVHGNFVNSDESPLSWSFVEMTFITVQRYYNKIVANVRSSTNKHSSKKLVATTERLKKEDEENREPTSTPVADFSNAPEVNMVSQSVQDPCVQYSHALQNACVQNFQVVQDSCIQNPHTVQDSFTTYPTSSDYSAYQNYYNNYAGQYNNHLDYGTCQANWNPALQVPYPDPSYQFSDFGSDYWSCYNPY